MALTYDSIATTTLGSATNIVEFSSITSSFTDLLLVIDTESASSTGNYVWRVNDDSNTSYSYSSLTGQGGGGNSESAKSTNTNSPLLNYWGYLATTRGNVLAHFLNYSNTTTFKQVISRSNNSGNGVALNIGLWRSTAAINKIYIAGSTNFAVGSVFTLYGIKAA